MLLQCVRFQGEQGVRRLRVIAGTAKLYSVLRRLSLQFSAATGIDVYFNYTTTIGTSSGVYIKAILAPPPIRDTPDESGGFDALISSPTFMPLVHQTGKMLDLRTLVESDAQLKWYEISNALRSQMVVFGNQVVAIPITTSPALLLYHLPTFQRDGLQVPATWDQVLQLAERYKGKDINGDGTPDFSVCLPPPNCFVDGALLRWLFSSFVQTHGSSQGIYLDSGSLTILANSSAMAEALSLLRKLRLLASQPPGDCTIYEDALYLEGRCLMSINTPSTFKTAYSPNAKSAYAAMRGHMGMAMFPGSTRVLDRPTGQMVPCDANRCPLARNAVVDLDGVQRPVNQPIPSSNVIVMLNAKAAPEYQFYAYSLFSFLASPQVFGTEDSDLVLDPDLETMPLRSSDLTPQAAAKWVARGYHPADVEQFFAAFRASLDNPNQAFEPRFPGVLNVSQASAIAASLYTNTTPGYQPPPAIVPASIIARTVAAVMAEQGGPEAFGRAYRLTLNWVPPPPSPPPGGGPGGVAASKHPRGKLESIVISSCVVGLLALVAVAAMLFRRRRRRHRLWHGAVEAPGAGPDTTILVTDIQSSTSLWEHLDAGVMDQALSVHHAVMRTAIAEWCGYESATEGDSFIVAFWNPTAALNCALAAQQALLDAPWPPGLLDYPPLPGLEGHEDPLALVAAVSLYRHKRPAPRAAVPRGDVFSSPFLSVQQPPAQQQQLQQPALKQAAYLRRAQTMESASEGDLRSQRSTAAAAAAAAAAAGTAAGGNGTGDGDGDGGCRVRKAGRARRAVDLLRGLLPAFVARRLTGSRSAGAPRGLLPIADGGWLGQLASGSSRSLNIGGAASAYASGGLMCAQSALAYVGPDSKAPLGSEGAALAAVAADWQQPRSPPDRQASGAATASGQLPGRLLLEPFLGPATSSSPQVMLPWPAPRLPRQMQGGQTSTVARLGGDVGVSGLGAAASGASISGWLAPLAPPSAEDASSAAVLPMAVQLTEMEAGAGDNGPQACAIHDTGTHPLLLDQCTTEATGEVPYGGRPEAAAGASRADSGLVPRSGEPGEVAQVQSLKASKHAASGSASRAATMLSLGSRIQASMRLIQESKALEQATQQASGPPQLRLQLAALLSSNAGTVPEGSNAGAPVTPVQSRLASVTQPSSGAGSATATGPALSPDAVTLFRGLRVRMGFWTGVGVDGAGGEVTVNAATFRTQYSGDCMRYAKAVADTAHGGMVVFTEASRARLDPAAVHTARHIVLYGGLHTVKLGGGGADPALHLYTAYGKALLPRASVVSPLRSLKALRPGVLEAPVMGYGTVVQLQVAGIGTLLSWNAAVAGLALESLHAAALRQLDEVAEGYDGGSGRGQPLGRPRPHVALGHASLLPRPPAHGRAGGSVTARSGLPPVPLGTMAVVFADAEAAVVWATGLRRAALELDWPPELLEHELAEEVWTYTPVMADPSSGAGRRTRTAMPADAAAAAAAPGPLLSPAPSAPVRARSGAASRLRAVSSYFSGRRTRLAAAESPSARSTLSSLAPQASTPTGLPDGGGNGGTRTQLPMLAGTTGAGGTGAAGEGTRELLAGGPMEGSETAPVTATVTREGVFVAAMDTGPASIADVTMELPADVAADPAEAMALCAEAGAAGTTGPGVVAGSSAPTRQASLAWSRSHSRQLVCEEGPALVCELAGAYAHRGTPAGGGIEARIVDTKALLVDDDFTGADLGLTAGAGTPHRPPVRAGSEVVNPKAADSIYMRSSTPAVPAHGDTSGLAPRTMPSPTFEALKRDLSEDPARGPRPHGKAGATHTSRLAQIVGAPLLPSCPAVTLRCGSGPAAWLPTPPPQGQPARPPAQLVSPPGGPGSATSARLPQALSPLTPAQMAAIEPPPVRSTNAPPTARRSFLGVLLPSAGPASSGCDSMYSQCGLPAGAAVAAASAAVARGDGSSGARSWPRASAGAPFQARLLYRGLRLRWGVASGPLKGSLTAGDVSGQISYRGKAYTTAAKLAVKARAGQICTTAGVARDLPAELVSELIIVEKV